MKRHTIIVVITILAFVIILASYKTTFAQVNDHTAIQTANQELNQAYTNVLAAEKAGGNITQLLEKLNTAGQLLAEAQNAYYSGNFDNVTSSVESARLLAIQVNSDAVNLRNVSVIESQNSLWMVLIFSVVGAVVFDIALLFVWRRFKHAHVTKVLGMKPEVIENTA